MATDKSKMDAVLGQMSAIMDANPNPMSQSVIKACARFRYLARNVAPQGTDHLHGVLLHYKVLELIKRQGVADDIKYCMAKEDENKFMMLLTEEGFSEMVTEAIQDKSPDSAASSAKQVAYQEMVERVEEIKAAIAANDLFTPVSDRDRKLAETWEDNRDGEAGTSVARKPNEMAVDYMYLLCKLMVAIEEFLMTQNGNFATMAINNDEEEKKNNCLDYITTCTLLYLRLIAGAGNKSWNTMMAHLRCLKSPMTTTEPDFNLLLFSEWLSTSSWYDNDASRTTHMSLLTFPRLNMLVAMCTSHRCRSGIMFSNEKTTASQLCALYKLELQKESMESGSRGKSAFSSLHMVWLLAINRYPHHCILGRFDLSADNSINGALGLATRESMERAKWSFFPTGNVNLKNFVSTHLNDAITMPQPMGDRRVAKPAGGTSGTAETGGSSKNLNARLLKTQVALVTAQSNLDKLATTFDERVKDLADKMMKDKPKSIYANVVKGFTNTLAEKDDAAREKYTKQLATLGAQVIALEAKLATLQDDD
jgi:predicted lactoylglutathione lyase